MQSIKLSHGFRFLLLLSLVGGTLAGCASPAPEISQIEEATVPESTEAQIMPTDPPPPETEEKQGSEPSESGFPESGVAHSAKTR